MICVSFLRAAIRTGRDRVDARRPAEPRPALLGTGRGQGAAQGGRGQGQVHPV